MSLLSSTGLEARDLVTFNRLAAASYRDGEQPEGWTSLTADDLGLSGDNFNGDYYELDGIFGNEAARVMTDGEGTLALSFRGTDSGFDVQDYPGLLVDPTAWLIGGTSYIHNFADLLDAVGDYADDAAHGVDDLWVTGHSLGAGAANQLRDVATDSDMYDDAFDAAEFVAFAAPNVDNDSGDILNLGFDNDLVYRITSVYADDNATGSDNFYYYNEDFANGSNKSVSAHGIYGENGEGPYADAIARLVDYGLVEQDGLDLDSLVLFDAYDGTVANTETDRKAVLVGETEKADDLVGGNADDFLIGGFGDDFLTGGAGADGFGFATDTLDAGGRTRVMDFTTEDSLIFSGLELQGPQTGYGDDLGAGEIDVLSGFSFTSLFVGVDGNAGADFEVRLAGNFDASGFQAAGNTLTFDPAGSGSGPVVAGTDGFDSFFV